MKVRIDGQVVELTAAQAKRLKALQLPDNTAERDAALKAAVAYLLGELTPETMGRRLAAARTAEASTLAAAKQVALLAIEDGAAEATTARQIGVDRMAVREWLGKRVR